MKEKKKSLMMILFSILLISISICGCGKQQTVSLNESTADDQPYWNVFSRHITKSESGYYYTCSPMEIEFDGMIYYMDGESGESIPLCGKAECSHADRNCNAVLDRDGYNTQQLHYYEGMLYVIFNDKTDGLSYLEQITADGSSRKRLFEIGAISPAYSLVFHDNSVYIYQRQGSVSGYTESTATIRRRSLDGREDEIAYEYTGKGAVIYAVKSYGGRLFFLVEEEGRSSTEEHSERVYTRKGIFAYDYSTREVQQVCAENVCDYTIDEATGTLYYYVFNDGLYIPLIMGRRKRLLRILQPVRQLTV